jgi:hypothetical protein
VAHRLPKERLKAGTPLHATGTLTLFIEPAPAAGLARLRWRLGNW